MSPIVIDTQGRLAAFGTLMFIIGVVVGWLLS
jgi:hypothetical protein